MDKSPGDKLHDDVWDVLKDMLPMQPSNHWVIPMISRLGLALCDYKIAQGGDDNADRTRDNDKAADNTG